MDLDLLIVQDTINQIQDERLTRQKTAADADKASQQFTATIVGFRDQHALVSVKGGAPVEAELLQDVSFSVGESVSYFLPNGDRRGYIDKLG